MPSIARPALLLMSLVAAAAVAQEVPRPVPKVGDVFEYTDRYVTVPCKRWEVKPPSADGLLVQQCADNIAYFDAGTGALVRIVTKDGDKLVQFTPRATSLEFPLAVGKTWKGKYEGYTNDDGANWSADSSCTVKAAEKVKVAAGEFDALRIECTDNWSSGPFAGTAKSTSWYAPKAGTVVKTVSDGADKWNMELARLQTR